jgi:predicted phosphodiesterase
MRIALISDIHEDIINLQLALDKIDRMQCDEIICLGDISGYSASHHNYLELRNARECLHLVQKYCSLIVTGNHDLHAAYKTPKISGFEFPANWYDMGFWQRNEISNGRVWLYEQDELNPLYTNEDTDYVFNLPELFIKKYGDLNVLFSHYIYPNLTGSEQNFYHAPDDFDAHKGFMKKLDAHISFSGHRHYAGLLVGSGKEMITKSFGRVYNLKMGDIVHVPAITRANKTSGFMVFNDEEKTIQTVKI